MTPRQIASADAWYADANMLCRDWAARSAYSVEQCAAVLALYSINCNWALNARLARRAILHGDIKGLVMRNRHTGAVTLSVPDHVRAILAGEPIEEHLTNGSKINNFYRSILLQDSCTNDRWIFRAFDKPQGEPWYPWVERAVRMLAGELGLPAYVVQARLWVAIQEAWES